MSEFALPVAQRGGFSVPQVPSAPPASNVEWYSGGATGSQFASASSPYATYSAPSSSGAAAYGSFEDEAPLLEELGIDIPAILSRTRSILTFRLGGPDLDSLDLGGPLIFMALLGLAHLVVGKLHFGYILGWTVVGSVLIWFVLNSIAASAGTAAPSPDDAAGRSIDLYSCCCLLGYCLLPLVLHALLALLLPRRSWVTLASAVVTVLWSAQTAARLFLRRTAALSGQHVVVAYPCALMYAAFALLTLY